LRRSLCDRLETTTSLLNQPVDKQSVVGLRFSSTEWLKRENEMDDQLSRVFAALADPTRRDMVARLTEGDATVGDLAAPYAVSIQAVSKHLKVLEEAGLVTRSRDAQRRPVHLEAEVFDLMTKWIERYRQRAEERFQRLDEVLAQMNDAKDATDTTPMEGTAS
jgi:DNA-binding transcriptional ArsR family regulator